MKNRKSRNLLVFSIALIFLTSIIIPNISGINITNRTYKIDKIATLNPLKVVQTHLSIYEKEDLSIIDYSEIKDKNIPLLYVFKLSPQGYIVVTADTCLPPVIAYSFSNNFGVINDGNVLLQMLKTDIKSRLNHVSKISQSILTDRYISWQYYLTFSEINVPDISTVGIGPLLDTQWSQGAPYKNFCPIDLSSGQRSVAGCPAVAMAQILNYHKTTRNIQFDDNDDYYHNYYGNKYWIDNDYETYDFPSFPELNSYLQTLEYHYKNEMPLTNDDKAAINFACGIAAKQVYHPSGSGTFGVNQAYNAYLRFSFNNVELLDEDDPDLFDRLYANIHDELPVHIAVVNEDWTVGHNMVVDGYNDGYYHINFGWGGSYDGWYLLPEELPYELTVIEGIVVDIIPTIPQSDLEGEGDLSWTNIITGSNVSGSFTIQNIGESGSIINWEIESYPYWGEWIFTPNSGEGLKPEDGKLNINVTVIAPKQTDEEFSGYVKVVNSDNNSDYCLIYASLTTPRNRHSNVVKQHFIDSNSFLLFLLRLFRNLL
jgi:hypothetical protein